MIQAAKKHYKYRWVYTSMSASVLINHTSIDEESSYNVEFTIKIQFHLKLSADRVTIDPSLKVYTSLLELTPDEHSSTELYCWLIQVFQTPC